MKRLIILCTTIILLLSFNGFSQTPIEKMILGKWKVESMKIGDQEVTASESGLEGYMTFNADQTVIFEMNGEVENTEYRLEGNLLYEKDVEEPSTILEITKETMSVMVDTELNGKTIKMTMDFKRLE